MKIKFVMSDKSEMSLSKEQAEAVLTSDLNIVMIADADGTCWSGKTINKSFLIRTSPDYDAMEGVADESHQLAERKPDHDKVIEALDEEKTKLVNKLGGTNDLQRK